MKRIAPLGFAVSALALATACSGGYNVIAPSPGPSGNAGVVFLVTAPVSSSSSSTRKPNIAAPFGTQSVSVQLQSVNGGAVTGGTPTTQNIAADAAGCTTAGNQLVCQFTVNSTAGADVFLVKMFGLPNAQGTATGAGNVSVNAAGGQNTTAPTVLTGTVASISISPPDLAVGVAGSGNLVVIAKDAQGNTILGTYANPLTLTLTDASNQTQLSGTSARNSSDAAAITLTYKGGAMTQAAMIGATASGVSASAVTSGKFLPDSSYPTTDGTTAYTVSYADNWSYDVTQTPSPGPLQSASETVTTSTSQSFNGLSNLVAVSATFSPDQPPAAQSFASFLFNTSGTTYYQWANASGAETLQRVGASGSDEIFGLTNLAQTCASPYQTAWKLPLGSWDSLTGTGPCTTSINVADGQGDSIAGKNVTNSDGSYAFNFGISETVPFPISFNITYKANSDGTATATANNYANGGSGCICPPGASGSTIATIGTPAPGASTIPVTVQSFPGSIPNPIPTDAPTPEATSIPNWYASAGVPNGTVPSPLQKDTFAAKTGNATLAETCNVESSVAPAGTTFSEVDETFYHLDPLSGYTTTNTQWFVASGIGVVCEVQNATSYYANGPMALAPSLFGSGGSDSWETYQSTYSLTPQILRAALATTHDFAKASRAAQAQMFAFAGQTRAQQIRRLLMRFKAHR